MQNKETNQSETKSRNLEIGKRQTWVENWKIKTIRASIEQAPPSKIRVLGDRKGKLDCEIK